MEEEEEEVILGAKILTLTVAEGFVNYLSTSKRARETPVKFRSATPHTLRTYRLHNTRQWIIRRREPCTYITLLFSQT